MIKAVNKKYNHAPGWETATPGTLAPFSAVCWYTGKAMRDNLATSGDDAAVGLMQTSVGGSPIEYWLPPTTNRCEQDTPQCDSQYPDSFFFQDIVTQFVPHTFGSFVWDQAGPACHSSQKNPQPAVGLRLFALSVRAAVACP